MYRAEETNQKVKLFARVILSKKTTPLRQKNVKLVPKPIKLEYRNTVHVLNDWASGHIHHDSLLTILKPDTFAVKAPREVSRRAVPFKETGLHRQRSVQLRSLLNSEQVTHEKKHAFILTSHNHIF